MVDGNYCLEKIVTDTLICGSVSCHKNYVSKNLAKNIIFREGVDTIGKGVSYRKKTDSYIIENVSLPNTLKCIANQSFEGCYQLQNIDLPNSIEEIGFDAFRGTGFGYKRDTLVLPPSIKRFALTAFTYPSKVYYFPEGTTYIDNTRIYAYYISSVGYEEHITPENPAVFHLRSSSPPEFHYLKDNYSSNMNALYNSLIYVPKGTSSLYKKTDPWDKATIIEEIFVEDVSIENSKLLYVGDRIKMKAEIQPIDATNQTVIWKSSNSDIVEISEDGILQAIANGTAVVTATTVDGGYEASCTINVFEHTTGIEVEEKVTLPIGETYTLNAHTLPYLTSDERIIYNSDNNDIAAVNSEFSLNL